MSEMNRESSESCWWLDFGPGLCREIASIPQLMLHHLAQSNKSLEDISLIIAVSGGSEL